MNKRIITFLCIAILFVVCVFGVVSVFKNTISEQNTKQNTELKTLLD